MSNKHTYVLGINAYDHDVSACLLRDGEIAFAINKERITRKKHGAHFRYVDANGHAVKDDATLARIKSLAIPPAWTHVWICPIANRMRSKSVVPEPPRHTVLASTNCRI